MDGELGNLLDGIRKPTKKPRKSNRRLTSLEEVERLLKGPSRKNVDKFFEAVRRAEGGEPDLIVGGKQRFDIKGDHPNIVGLTTKEGGSTAAGNYQITGSNWYRKGGLKERLGAKDFSPENQLKAAVMLLGDRSPDALKALENGDWDTATKYASLDWAALPGSKLHNGKGAIDKGRWNKYLGLSDSNELGSLLEGIRDQQTPPTSELGSLLENLRGSAPIESQGSTLDKEYPKTIEGLVEKSKDLNGQSDIEKSADDLVKKSQEYITGLNTERNNKYNEFLKSLPEDARNRFATEVGAGKYKNDPEGVNSFLTEYNKEMLAKETPEQKFLREQYKGYLEAMNVENSDESLKNFNQLIKDSPSSFFEDYPEKEIIQRAKKGQVALNKASADNADVSEAGFRPLHRTLTYEGLKTRNEFKRWADRQMNELVRERVPGATDQDIEMANNINPTVYNFTDQDNPNETTSKTVNFKLGAQFLETVQAVVTARKTANQEIKDKVKKDYITGKINEIPEKSNDPYQITFDSLKQEGIYFDQDEYNQMIEARRNNDNIYRGRVQEKVNNGISPVIADLETRYETGRITGKQFAEQLSDERRAYLEYKDEFDKAVKNRGAIQKMAESMVMDSNLIMAKEEIEKEASPEKMMQDLINEFGSLRASKMNDLYKQQAWNRIMKRFVDQPMLTTVDAFVKPVVKGVINLAPQTLDTLAGLLETSDYYTPLISIPGKLIPGSDEYKAEAVQGLKSIASQIKGRIDDEFAADEDMRQFSYFSSTPEALGGVLTQIVATYLTGSSILGAAIGGAQAASEQLNKADADPNASIFDKAVVLGTSILYAMPDVFILKGFGKFEENVARAMWYDRFLNSMYRKAVSVFGEKEALNLTRNILRNILMAGDKAYQGWLRPSVFEGTQESTEETANSATARLLYDNTRQVLLFNPDDFWGGFLLGPIGGAIEFASEVSRPSNIQPIGIADYLTNQERAGYVADKIREAYKTPETSIPQKSIQDLVSGAVENYVGKRQQSLRDQRLSAMREAVGEKEDSPTVEQLAKRSVEKFIDQRNSDKFQQIEDEYNSFVTKDNSPLFPTSNIPQTRGNTVFTGKSIVDNFLEARATEKFDKAEKAYREVTEVPASKVEVSSMAKSAVDKFVDQKSKEVPKTELARLLGDVRPPTGVSFSPAILGPVLKVSSKANSVSADGSPASATRAGEEVAGTASPAPKPVSIKLGKTGGKQVSKLLALSSHHLSKDRSFPDWFRKSKALDRDGSPLVLFHGASNFVGNRLDPRQTKEGMVHMGTFNAANDRLGIVENTYFDEGEHNFELIPVVIRAENPLELDSYLEKYTIIPILGALKNDNPELYKKIQDTGLIPQMYYDKVENNDESALRRFRFENNLMPAPADYLNMTDPTDVLEYENRVNDEDFHGTFNFLIPALKELGYDSLHYTNYFEGSQFENGTPYYEKSWAVFDADQIRGVWDSGKDTTTPKLLMDSITDNTSDISELPKDHPSFDLVNRLIENVADRLGISKAEYLDQIKDKDIVLTYRDKIPVTKSDNPPALLAILAQGDPDVKGVLKAIAPSYLSTLTSKEIEILSKDLGVTDKGLLPEAFSQKASDVLFGPDKPDNTILNKFFGWLKKVIDKIKSSFLDAGNTDEVQALYDHLILSSSSDVTTKVKLLMNETMATSDWMYNNREWMGDIIDSINFDYEHYIDDFVTGHIQDRGLSRDTQIERAKEEIDLLLDTLMDNTYLSPSHLILSYMYQDSFNKFWRPQPMARFFKTVIDSYNGLYKDILDDTSTKEASIVREALDSYLKSHNFSIQAHQSVVADRNAWKKDDPHIHQIERSEFDVVLNRRVKWKDTVWNNGLSSIIKRVFDDPNSISSETNTSHLIDGNTVWIIKSEGREVSTFDKTTSFEDAVEKLDTPRLIPSHISFDVDVFKPTNNLDNGFVNSIYHAIDYKIARLIDGSLTSQGFLNYLLSPDLSYAIEATEKSYKDYQNIHHGSTGESSVEEAMKFYQSIIAGLQASQLPGVSNSIRGAILFAKEIILDTTGVSLPVISDEALADLGYFIESILQGSAPFPFSLPANVDDNYLANLLTDTKRENTVEEALLRSYVINSVIDKLFSEYSNFIQKTQEDWGKTTWTSVPEPVGGLFPNVTRQVLKNLQLKIEATVQGITTNNIELFTILKTAIDGTYKFENEYSGNTFKSIEEVQDFLVSLLDKNKPSKNDISPVISPVFLEPDFAAITGIGKMVSKDFILQNMKRYKAKKIDTDLVNEIFNSKEYEKGKFDFDKFLADFSALSIPLQLIKSSHYADYGVHNIGYDSLGGTSETHIWNSPVVHGYAAHWVNEFSDFGGYDPSRLRGKYRINPRTIGNRTFYEVRIDKETFERSGRQLNQVTRIDNSLIGSFTTPAEAVNFVRSNIFAAQAIKSGLFGHTRVLFNVRDLSGFTYSDAQSADYLSLPKDLDNYYILELQGEGHQKLGQEAFSDTSSKDTIVNMFDIINDRSASMLKKMFEVWMDQGQNFAPTVNFYSSYFPKEMRDKSSKFLITSEALHTAFSILSTDFNVPLDVLPKTVQAAIKFFNKASEYVSFDRLDLTTNNISKVTRKRDTLRIRPDFQSIIADSNKMLYDNLMTRMVSDLRSAIPESTPDEDGNLITADVDGVKHSFPQNKFIEVYQEVFKLIEKDFKDTKLALNRGFDLLDDKIQDTETRKDRSQDLHDILSSDRFAPVYDFLISRMFEKSKEIFKANPEIFGTDAGIRGFSSKKAFLALTSTNFFDELINEVNSSPDIKYNLDGLIPFDDIKISSFARAYFLTDDDVTEDAKQLPWFNKELDIGTKDYLLYGFTSGVYNELLLKYGNILHNNSGASQDRWNYVVDTELDSTVSAYGTFANYVTYNLILSKTSVLASSLQVKVNELINLRNQKQAVLQLNDDLTEAIKEIPKEENLSVGQKQFLFYKNWFAKRLLSEELTMAKLRGFNFVKIPTPQTLARIEKYIDPGDPLFDPPSFSYDDQVSFVKAPELTPLAYNGTTNLKIGDRKVELTNLSNINPFLDTLPSFSRFASFTRYLVEFNNGEIESRSKVLGYTGHKLISSNISLPTDVIAVDAKDIFDFPVAIPFNSFIPEAGRQPRLLDWGFFDGKYGEPVPHVPGESTDALLADLSDELNSFSYYFPSKSLGVLSSYGELEHISKLPLSVRSGKFQGPTRGLDDVRLGALSKLLTGKIDVNISLAFMPGRVTLTIDLDELYNMTKEFEKSFDRSVLNLTYNDIRRSELELKQFILDKFEEKVGEEIWGHSPHHFSSNAAKFNAMEVELSPVGGYKILKLNSEQIDIDRSKLALRIGTDSILGNFKVPVQTAKEAIITKYVERPGTRIDFRDVVSFAANGFLENLLAGEPEARPSEFLAVIPANKIEEFEKEVKEITSKNTGNVYDTYNGISKLFSKYGDRQRLDEIFYHAGNTRDEYEMEELFNSEDEDAHLFHLDVDRVAETMYDESGNFSYGIYQNIPPGVPGAEIISNRINRTHIKNTFAIELLTQSTQSLFRKYLPSDLSDALADHMSKAKGKKIKAVENLLNTLTTNNTPTEWDAKTQFRDYIKKYDPQQQDSLYNVSIEGFESIRFGSRNLTDTDHFDRWKWMPDKTSSFAPPANSIVFASEDYSRFSMKVPEVKGISNEKYSLPTEEDITKAIIEKYKSQANAPLAILNRQSELIDLIQKTYKDSTIETDPRNNTWLTIDISKQIEGTDVGDKIGKRLLYDAINDQALTSIQEALSQKEDIDDAFLASMEFKVNGNGDLEINPYAAELLRRLNSMNDDSDTPHFKAVMLRKSNIEGYVSILNNVIDDAIESGNTLQQLQKLIDFRDVLKQSGSSMVAFLDEASYPHEKIHELRYFNSGLAENIKDYFHDWDKVKNSLADIEKKVYESGRLSYLGKTPFDELPDVARQILHEETFTYVTDGEFEKIGLTLEEAEKVILTDIDSYVKKHGTDLLNDLGGWINEKTRTAAIVNAIKPSVEEEIEPKENSESLSKETGRRQSSSKNSALPTGKPEGESKQDKAQLEERQFAVSVSEETSLNLDDMSEMGRFYEKVNQAEKEQDANNWFAILGPEEAYRQAFSQPATALGSARRIAVLKHLDAAIDAAINSGDEGRAIEIYKAHVDLTNSIAPEYTEYGQAISQLARWGSKIDPESITWHIESQLAKREDGGELTLEERNSFKQQAKEISDLEDRVAELTELLEGRRRKGQESKKAVNKRKQEAIKDLSEVFSSLKDTNFSLLAHTNLETIGLSEEAGMSKLRGLMFDLSLALDPVDAMTFSDEIVAGNKDYIQKALDLDIPEHSKIYLRTLLGTQKQPSIRLLMSNYDPSLYQGKTLDDFDKKAQAALVTLGRIKFEEGRNSTHVFTFDDWKSSIRNELSSNNLDPAKLEGYYEALYIQIKNQIKAERFDNELKRIKDKYNIDDNTQARNKLIEEREKAVRKIKIDAEFNRASKPKVEKRTPLEAGIDTALQSDYKDSELTREEIMLVRDKNAFFGKFKDKGFSATEQADKYFEAIQIYSDVYDELKQAKLIVKARKSLGLAGQNALLSDEEVNRIVTELNEIRREKQRKTKRLKLDIDQLLNRPQTSYQKARDWYLRVNRAGEALLTATIATATHNIIAQRTVKFLNALEVALELGIAKAEKQAGVSWFANSPTDIPSTARFRDMIKEEIKSSTFPSVQAAMVKAFQDYKNGEFSLMATLQLIRDHKQQVVEGILAYNPELYEDMLGDYSYGDFKLEKHRPNPYLGTAGKIIEGGVQGLEKWTSWATTLNQLQEKHFRFATFIARVAIELKASGIDLDQVIAGGNEGTIPYQTLFNAIHRGLEDTFAEEIPKTGTFGRLATTLHNSARWIPFPINILLFRKFAYNSNKYTFEHSPLVLAKIASKNGLTRRDMSKAIMGMGLVSLSTMLLSAFGTDDDEPTTLKFGDYVVRMSAYNPVSTFLILANIPRRLIKGKPAFPNTASVYRLFGVDTRYPNPGIEFWGSVAHLGSNDINRYDKFREQALKTGAKGLAAYLRPVVVVKDIWAGISEEEATVRDAKDYIFTGELSKTIPYIGRSFDPRYDVETGDVLKKEHSILDQFGISIVPNSEVGAKMTAAEEFLDNAVREERQNNTKYRNPADRSKSYYMARLYEWIDKGASKEQVRERLSDFKSRGLIDKDQKDKILDYLKLKGIERKARPANIDQIFEALVIATPDERQGLIKELRRKKLSQTRRGSLTQREKDLLKTVPELNQESK